jgi:outer membrane protein assembly factor BamD
VPDARTKLAQCRKLLAKKELYIGDFYNRDDQYESAKRRYEKLIENFPESEEAEAARKKLPAVEKALAKQQAEKLAEKKKE